MSFNLGWISHFVMQNAILTFELGPNITFWHSKSYFDIQIRPIIEFWNPILTFIFGPNISFWHLKSSFFIFELGPIIALWYSKSYSNWGRISRFYTRFPNLTFELGGEYYILTTEILFWHLNLGQISRLTTEILFDFQIRAQYRISMFDILFCHLNFGRISHFTIRNPILTFELGPNIPTIWKIRMNSDWSHFGLIFQKWAIYKM